MNAQIFYDNDLRLLAWVADDVLLFEVSNEEKQVLATFSMFPEEFQELATFANEELPQDEEEEVTAGSATWRVTGN
jgi:hypothetical protein